MIEKGKVKGRGENEYFIFGTQKPPIDTMVHLIHHISAYLLQLTEVFYFVRSDNT